MKIRIINAPTPEVMAMLAYRMRPQARESLQSLNFRAVGLVQANVADLFYFADVAGKASFVVTTELSGNCPQQLTTLAVFGEISAVRVAMQAIVSDASDQTL